jgi:HEAT repeat protein
MRLLRFAEDGTKEERRLALRLIPVRGPATGKKLLALTKTEDQQVAVIAWARLLGHPTHRAAAQKTLIKWARSGSEVAVQASSALSAAGDKRIVPLMKEQMKASTPASRRVAGSALIRLGALSDVAPLLADEDKSVRRTIACRTLARPALPPK